MNHLPNGEIAVGAPGSLERCKQEYSVVIAEIRRYLACSYTYKEAMTYLERQWQGLGLSVMEKENILLAAGY